MSIVSNAGGQTAGKRELTPKQRMLNAYRGIPNDRPAAAPEFWYYYPAKTLGVDMMEFHRNVPFHLALKTTFEKFACEGWGIFPVGVENHSGVSSGCSERRLDTGEFLLETVIKTPAGNLKSSSLFSRTEPPWTVERPVKDIERDLPAFELAALGGDPEKLTDIAAAEKALRDVGESYLLEGWLGAPFFDFFAGAREGGFQTAVIDFLEHEGTLGRLQEKHTDFMRRKTAALCRNTKFESFALGCAWSCNSLIGPEMWRKWDKPLIKALAEETHRHGRLLHVHFHGKCMETIGDFAELGIDCVCPFERPPGGDIDGLSGLRQTEKILRGRVTMNGNVHTVDTLIRGKPDDARREVREILEAFAGNPRVIVGTGDQVGYETPEENLHAMIDEVKKNSR
jgi:uroporphyrinogen-III decarboxylase